MIKYVLWIAAAIVFAACPLYAASYYVDQNHPAAADANPGTEALPWKTIGKANSALLAGDTVYIKAGAYNDATIQPAHSGSSEALRITYRNYENDVVTIANAVTYSVGLRLDTKSYITVHGLNFTGQNRFLYIRQNSSHNIIAYCNFDDAKLTNGAIATWAGSVISGSSQHNWIHHCRFSNYGYYNADDIGCVLDIGAEENKEDETRYNLIENNVFYHGGHHVVGVYGKYNVIRNNYFHNEPWALGTAASDRGAVLYGNRNLSFSGYSENGGRNLFESNRVGYSSDPSDNNGASGMALNSSENIVRFNTFFNNISAGLSLSLTSSYLQSIVRNKVYSNTFFNNGHNPYDPVDHMSSGIGLGIYSGSLVIENNVFKNNLLYAHTLAIGEYNINTSNRKGLIAAQVFANNWDGDTQGDPKFVNADTAFYDPMLVTLPNLRLQDTSPCKDAGTHLTTITSASGSGTTFTVADAGYFMDGWGVSGIGGDRIQLAGAVQKARILSVNYATNTITVDTTLSWTQGQGVSLPYEGTAPDAGAYEIGAASDSMAPAAPRGLTVN